MLNPFFEFEFPRQKAAKEETLERLSALETAIYVLKCLSEGQRKPGLFLDLNWTWPMQLCIIADLVELFSVLLE